MLYHAAGHHDVGIASLDHLIREINGVQTRETHLVHVDRGNAHRNSGLARRLARGHLTLSCHQHLTHDHVVDVFGLHTGAFKCGFDGESAEICSAELMPVHRSSCRLVFVLPRRCTSQPLLSSAIGHPDG